MTTLYLPVSIIPGDDSTLPPPNKKIHFRHKSLTDLYLLSTMQGDTALDYLSLGYTHWLKEVELPNLYQEAVLKAKELYPYDEKETDNRKNKLSSKRRRFIAGADFILSHLTGGKG